VNLGRPEAPSALNASGLRVGLVTARFNARVTRRLTEGAEASLRQAAIDPEDIDRVWVPGAFELAPTARRLAVAGRLDAVVCLGAVIAGGTDHYQYVCQSVTDGLTRLAQDAVPWGRHGVAVTFGVLTCANLDQALARAGGSEGNKGADAALAALEVALLWRDLPRPPVA
jgi:6,7-dimethyl-8-ribityllumazine synthase